MDKGYVFLDSSLNEVEDAMLAYVIVVKDNSGLQALDDYYDRNYDSTDDDFHKVVGKIKGRKNAKSVFVWDCSINEYIEIDLDVIDKVSKYFNGLC